MTANKTYRVALSSGAEEALQYDDYGTLQGLGVQRVRTPAGHLYLEGTIEALRAVRRDAARRANGGYCNQPGWASACAGLARRVDKVLARHTPTCASDPR